MFGDFQRMKLAQGLGLRGFYRVYQASFVGALYVGLYAGALYVGFCVGAYV